MKTTIELKDKRRAERRAQKARAREHAEILRMLYGDAFTPAQYRRAGRGVEMARAARGGR